MSKSKEKTKIELNQTNLLIKSNFKHNQNPKINKKLFIEYQKREQEKTIFLHNLSICFLLLVNFLGFFLLLFFYFQIREENNFQIIHNKELTNLKSKNKKFINEIETFHLRIEAYLDLEKDYFTTIFNNVEEFNFVFNKITDIERTYMHQCYKGTIDGFNSREFENYCTIGNIVILIRTFDDKRFGIYMSKAPLSTYDEEIKIENDNYCFLFSLDYKKIYKPKKSPAYAFRPNNFFTVGINDIIINNNYNDNNSTCSCNFPKNFGNSEDKFCEITGGKEKFGISDMEVYILL